MIASSAGAMHFAAAFAALALGALVLAMPKGTLLHRTMGTGYIAAMIILNIAALAIYRLTGHFEPFHALALLSLATIARGVAPAVRRRPGWLVLWLGPISPCWPRLAAKSSFGWACGPGFWTARGRSSPAV